MFSIVLSLSAIVVAGVFDDDKARITFRRLKGDILTVEQTNSNGSAHRREQWANSSEILELPSDFDSREKFKECAGIIGHVRDQSNCGSCAAMAVIGVFNDRLCIKTGGKFNKLLSPGYAVACCTPDTGCKKPAGCSGSTSTELWGFAEIYGIPTGGDYKPPGSMTKDDGCWPYEFPQCDHTYEGGGKYPACSKDLRPTPSCPSSCLNRKYTTTIYEDLQFVAPPGQVLVNPEVDKIKQEIFNNGPVVAAFRAYEDFRHYTSGVYKHKYGKFVTYHYVKLIGWGKTPTEEYWLAVNSWNEEWGESGLFKIALHECEIEQYVNYGVPSL